MTTETKIIAVAIQKGGCGKTFISLHASYLLAENSFPKSGRPTPRKAHKVCLLDIDPQCNSTLSLLTRDPSVAIDYPPENTTAALFGWNGSEEGPMWDMELPFPNPEPVPPVYGNFYDGQLWCVPGHETALADVDAMDAEQAFEAANRIRKFAEESEFDVVVIDCSPQLGIRQLVAMLAADHIITPINTDMYSEEGAIKLAETYVAVRDSNTDCQLHIIPNSIDAKSKANLNILDRLKESVGDFMTDSYIPYSNSISNAINTGRPVWRQPPSGNDALVGRQVRAALSELLLKCGFDAK